MNVLIILRECKNNLFKKENLYYLTLVTIIFFFDRYLKVKIVSNFNDNVYYINDYLNLDLVWNIGIGFGLFGTESTLFYNFITFIIGVVISILAYFFIISNKIDKLIYLSIQLYEIDIVHIRYEQIYIFVILNI